LLASTSRWSTEQARHVSDMQVGRRFVEQVQRARRLAMHEFDGELGSLRLAS
jgi:hypothetical protein